MTWLQRVRVQHYIRNSIWLLPALGMGVGIFIVRGLHWFEMEMGLKSSLNPDSARAVLGALASSIFTLVVFVSSALLVVLQLASSQLSPRIIGIVFRDPVTKLSITAFVFTFTVTLATLARIDESAPMLTTQLANFSCIGSLVLFLYMIDHLGKALRPSGVLRRIALMGKETIETVYPELLVDASGIVRESRDVKSMSIEHPFVVNSHRDGVFLGFDRAGLRTFANTAKCTIELVPQLGDFVASGSPLFRLTEQANAYLAKRMRNSVFLDQERELENDPMLAFRILVDIAAKALSPGINDPTTAVLALDQIQNLLEAAGQRNLSEGQFENERGLFQLVYRTPNWEDFVRLSVTEIRLFGGDSIQVVRRLRAMLEYLIHMLPEGRRAVLQRELSLLHKKADRSFSDPDDRAMAEVSDMQGVGGATVDKLPDVSTARLG